MHTKRKRVFFYRDYQRFQGGHLKVWNYFQHVLASATHEPCIYFSANSSWDSSNPWSGCHAEWLLNSWDPHEADVLFLAGLDWQHVPLSSQTPTINLIQHVRHGDQGDPRREFLSRPALRLCVSEDVRQAILATGLVMGPVVTIPNGVDLPTLNHNIVKQEDRVLILGLKNPGFAGELAERLMTLGIKSELVVEPLPRSEFLQKIALFQVVIALPHEREGFFLPALEAMGLNCIVICPDCVGNRDFCFDSINAFRPQYRLDAVVEATRSALNLDAAGRQSMLMECQKSALQHSLSTERATFLSLLRDLETDWRSVLMEPGSERRR